MKQRLLALDAIKGLAILMVVMGHIYIFLQIVIVLLFLVMWKILLEDFKFRYSYLLQGFSLRKK